MILVFLFVCCLSFLVLWVFRPMAWCISFLRNSLLSLKIFLLLCSLTHSLVQKRGVDTCPHTATGDPLHACTTGRGSVPSPACLPSLSVAPSGSLWGKLVSECRLPLCLQHRQTLTLDWHSNPHSAASENLSSLLLPHWYLLGLCSHALPRVTQLVSAISPQMALYRPLEFL